MKKLMCILGLAMLWIHAMAQPSQPAPTQLPPEDSPEALQRYVPVLPPVKAQFWKIDPKLGYAVKSVGGGVYVISDNGWQSAFLVTDEGVIVFDAPASFGKSIPSAIAKVTDKPIKILVYSHTQRSHRRFSGVQRHQRSADRRAGYSRRFSQGNERSESIGAERNIQNGEDDLAGRQNGRAHTPRLSLE
jgi:hypothetical protein